MRKTGTLWTAEEDGALRDGIKAGVSIHGLAIRLNRSVSAVKTRAWENGLRFAKAVRLSNTDRSTSGAEAANYRIIITSLTGAIVRSHRVTVDDDQQAIETALKLNRAGVGLEVWRGARLVHEILPEIT